MFVQHIERVEQLRATRCVQTFGVVVDWLRISASRCTRASDIHSQIGCALARLAMHRMHRSDTQKSSLSGVHKSYFTSGTMLATSGPPEKWIPKSASDLAHR